MDEGRSTSTPLSLALVGQALIKRPVAGTQDPGFERVLEVLRQSDHRFTNFEGSIEGRFGGVRRKDKYFAISEPAVLEDLRTLGFDMLALSNNHAYDFGEGGVLSTLEETERRGFVTAGAGESLRAAGTVRMAVGGRIALLSVDCGPQPDEVYARDEGPLESVKAGINRLRITRHGDELSVDAADDARLLEAIRRARTTSEQVMVYFHSHHWEQPMWRTPRRIRGLARSWVDAGATLVAGHGTPCMQGLEIYAGAPIFYGLGNFIFHSWNPDRWFGDVGLRAWQSVIATCRWGTDGALEAVELVPVAVGHRDAEARLPFFDHPVVATGAYGRQILELARQICADLGTKVVDSEDGAARVLI